MKIDLFFLRMRKLSSLLLLMIIAVSCNNPFQKFISGSEESSDTTLDFSPVDTLALTLDALRMKRLPNGYKMIGDIKTATLTYAGCQMGDGGYFIFVDDAGNEILFSGNDTQFHLAVKSQNPTEENGGFDPNPQYLNRKFQTFWRRIQLENRPQNENELYYQEFDEIIFMKLLPRPLLQADTVSTNVKARTKTRK